MPHQTLLTAGVLLALALGRACSLDFQDKWITRPPVEYEFPHVVYITIPKTGEFCTGSIIHKSWVLTAASCMYQGTEDLIKDVDTALVVYAGVTDRAQLKTPNAQQRKSVKVQFPDKVKDALYYSPALISVDRPFDLNRSKGVAIAYLSSIEFGDDVYDKCDVAGFGVYDSANKTGETRLKKLDLNMYGCGCNKEMKEVFPKSLVDEGLCGKSLDFLVICKGDFGTGVICDGDLQAVSVGLMKLKSRDSCEIVEKASSTCNEKTVVGLFVDTCYYLEWMKQFVPGVKSPRKPCIALAWHPRANLSFVWTVVLSNFVFCL